MSYSTSCLGWKGQYWNIRLDQGFVSEWCLPVYEWVTLLGTITYPLLKALLKMIFLFDILVLWRVYVICQLLIMYFLGQPSSKCKYIDSIECISECRTFSNLLLPTMDHFPSMTPKIPEGDKYHPPLQLRRGHLFVVQNWFIPPVIFRKGRSFNLGCTLPTKIKNRTQPNHHQNHHKMS